MDNPTTVAVIGSRRYVTPVVVTGVVETVSPRTCAAFVPVGQRTVAPLLNSAVAALLVSIASVAPTIVAERGVDVSGDVASVGEITPRILQPITDADGVAFDDGNGGVFHIY
jgi:hypothetical protein